MNEESLNPSPNTNPESSSQAGSVAAPLPTPSEHTSQHTLTINNQQLSYEATVGTINIDTDKVKPAASIFYTACNLLDKTGKSDNTRPVTFAFNGGPGASSTFLLMGSIGPKRINIPDAAPVPGSPYELSDNPYSILPFSDIVFIDAAGAGFSKIVPAAKKELWSVDGDVKGFSAFIRAYLSKYHRWNSPKYILGESYGTTRGSALAYQLQEGGIALNGLILLSSILDYAYTFATSDQYYIGYFPTYAAIGKYQGKAGDNTSMSDHLLAARAFANGPLRQALSQGDRLDEATREKVAQQYSELTGLTEQYVLDSNLRVVDPRFRKELLRSQGKIVGRYDARTTGYDLDVMSDDETFVVDDSFLNPAYSSLSSAYLRDHLGWDGQDERIDFADFDWNSMEPGKGWTWWHQLPEHSLSSWGRTLPFPKVTPDLAATIIRQPTLKVMICNGIFDLATPFGQTEYDIDHMGLPKPLQANIAFTYYPAGHMVYTNPESAEKFSQVLQRFYSSSAEDMPKLNERPELAHGYGIN